MGGQMHQSNAAATALYDHPGNGGPTGIDAGDAVMARWLQSAGLQHLASPLAASTGMDPRLAPNLLMQGYGAQSAEEKQRISKLMRNLNFNGEPGSEPYTPTQSSGGFTASDGFNSSEFRGDFGAGLLDLHSMDDTELLSEHVDCEPFEPSPFMPAVTKAFDSDFDVMTSQPQQGEIESDVPSGFPANESDNSTRENSVAKIKVVVRKRPLNKKELARKEDDIVTVHEDAYLTVHEPKLKVDLTAYVEKHEFCFDAVLDEHVSNDEVYRATVEPIIPTIFQRTKATCFAYGQTGSGKTYTMQPLPLRASEHLVKLLHQPVYRNQKFKLWLSYFEIYGGKLYDLLSDRKKLCMREDGRQQVCIVGLQEFEVSDVQIVKEFIEKGNASRSTGSTGANEESSRSHAILQLVVKKHNEIKDTRRNNDANESKVVGKVVGKISFIDLAGSERGADTTDNDRQTRIEGAEINKSLLALKECIRALDNDQIHIPFRGSKLTEVLRDSFVGNSRTVMISCISPNAGSCEHTLNTLRYADRVKSLSKTGNPKKDQSSLAPPVIREPVSAPSSSATFDTEEVDQYKESKVMDPGKRAVEKDYSSYGVSAEFDRQPSSLPSTHTSSSREESTATTVSGKDKIHTKNVFGGSANLQTFSAPFYQNASDPEEKVQRVSPPRRQFYKDERSNVTSSSYRQQNTTQTNADAEEKVQKNSPPRRRAFKDERLEKLGNGDKKDGGPTSSDMPTSSYRQQSLNNPNTYNSGSRQYETDPRLYEDSIDEILEEEESLIASHRKEIEDTMEIVREEMKLLAEVDQPGSQIDNYVTQLSFVLSRKAASLVSLQARLARFQHRLKEQEILSRKRTTTYR